MVGEKLKMKSFKEWLRVRFIMDLCSIESEVVEVQKQDIRKALDYLYPLDDVFELCALNVKENKTEIYEWTSKKYPMGGWFQNKDAAVDLALALDQKAGADAIYVTLNPCQKDLLASVNERIAELQNRTADDNVKQYRNFLIDIDPIRKSKIPSSDEEHEYALAYAKTIMNILSKLGWPKPMFCDSGNGAHLIYKIDMDVTDESIGLLKTCLMTLSQKYSNEKVDIDEKVFNPARITKLYGTHARKGDGSDDRPHRLSQIISIPDNPQIVTKEQLEALAAEYVEEVETVETPKLKSKTSSSTSSISHQPDVDYRGINLEAYFNAYGVNVLFTKKIGSTIKYCLDECIFDPSHSPNEASFDLNANGVICYQCFHDSCGEHKWEDARKAISGDDKLTQFMLKEFQESISRKKQQRIKLEIFSAADLENEDLPDVEWIIDDLIPVGLSMIAGDPKEGKSFFALQMAIDKANGEKFLGKFHTQKADVLFLGLEDNRRRLKKRMKDMDLGNPPNLFMSTKWEQQSRGGLDDLVDVLNNNSNLKLVVIDTFGHFRDDINSNNKTMYQEEVKQLRQIKSIAEEYQIAILLVHHLRKTDGKNVFEKFLGSVGVYATLDAAIGMESGKALNEKVISFNSRDAEFATFSIFREPSTCVFTADPSEKVVQNETVLKIIQLLEFESRPMRSKEIEIALGQEGICDNTVRSWLRKMKASGQIINIEHGLYVLPHFIELYNKRNNATNSICTEEIKEIDDVNCNDNHQFVVLSDNIEQQNISNNINRLDDNVVHVANVVPSCSNDLNSIAQSTVQHDGNVALNNNGAQQNTTNRNLETESVDVEEDKNSYSQSDHDDVPQQDESDASNQISYEDIELASFDADESIDDDSTVHDEDQFGNEQSDIEIHPQNVNSARTDISEPQKKGMAEFFEALETVVQEFNKHNGEDVIDGILASDMDDKAKFFFTTLYLDPPLFVQNKLTDEEVDFYENRFSDFPDEDSVQEEVGEVNMN